MQLVARILLLPLTIVMGLIGLVVMAIGFLAVMLMMPIVVLFGKRTVKNGKVTYKL